MKMRLLVAIAGLVSLVPVYGSTIVVRPRGEGDNTVRADGTAGNQFNDTDDWLYVQPVRPRDGQPPLNERRGMIEFDVFGSFGDPFLEASNDWQPWDNVITRALLHIHIDSEASGSGRGPYEVYGYRARNQLQADDSANDPNRQFVGAFETRVNIDRYVTIEIDAAWLQHLWNKDWQRIRPGFQIRATSDSPNRLAIDAFNNDCECYNFDESPYLELTFSSVPEPSSLGLMGFGLVGLAGLARRVRR
jgi:hypothetical protein